MKHNKYLIFKYLYYKIIIYITIIRILKNNNILLVFAMYISHIIYISNSINCTI